MRDEDARRYFLASRLELRINGRITASISMCALFMVWIALALGITSADASENQLPGHLWQEITFLDIAKGDTGQPSFSVYCDQQKGVQLHIEVDASDKIAAIPDVLKGPIAARLYRENGDTAASVGGNLDHPIGLSDMGVTAWQADTFFPWGKNTLEAAWIEVDLGAERYWLELPYGFDRNPHDKLPPAVTGKQPVPPPALRSLTAHDHALPWQSVTYDLGKIQKGWQLTLNQSNPGDGRSEIVLYRDDSAVGKSMYLWDLYSPRTAVHGIDSDGTVIGSQGVNIHLDDDGFRRTDSFNLWRYPSNENTRCWGQIEIKVDTRMYRVTVPSSLYKYEHGHAGR